MTKLREGIEFPIIPEDFILSETDPFLNVKSSPSRIGQGSPHRSKTRQIARWARCFLRKSLRTEAVRK
jgi:hypothetical protein